MTYSNTFYEVYEVTAQNYGFNKCYCSFEPISKLLSVYKNVSSLSLTYNQFIFERSTIFFLVFVVNYVEFRVRIKL